MYTTGIMQYKHFDLRILHLSESLQEKLKVLYEIYKKNVLEYVTKFLWSFKGSVSIECLFSLWTS